MRCCRCEGAHAVLHACAYTPPRAGVDTVPQLITSSEACCPELLCTLDGCAVPHLMPAFLVTFTCLALGGSQDI